MHYRRRAQPEPGGDIYEVERSALDRAWTLCFQERGRFVEVTDSQWEDLPRSFAVKPSRQLLASSDRWLLDVFDALYEPVSE